MELSVLIVSYCTREMTLACLRSVFRETRGVDFQVLVVDNASSDGSADAIAKEFPDVRIIALEENIGFARANNLAAREAVGEYLLLLNPDTEVRDGAVQALLAFARAHPDHGIYGGRTVFADGSPNPTSFWGRKTPWSVFCQSAGLTTLFRRSRLFNPEGIGWWWTGTEREVDIVSGCFFLLPSVLWQRLGGFEPEFFMYGEEADLCLRARTLGVRPAVCSAAVVVHHGGASEATQEGKLVKLYGAIVRLTQRHWGRAARPFGPALLAFGVLLRAGAYTLLASLGRNEVAPRAATWRALWRRRGEWLAPPAAPARGPTTDALR
jgi:hypothetical protein